MATGFNLFDFSSLGGNQLNKAVSNQKLPTTAPAMPWVVPKFSPVQNTIGWEARISNTLQYTTLSIINERILQIGLVDFKLKEKL